jgi:hypothetical protein
MEPICAPWLLIVAGLVLFALIAGALILIKLGVIARYATREEPPDTSEYRLDQSRERKNQ